ncbi:MAG: hypothetical protein ACKO14_02275 [Armatimonadota bacterium]
MATFRTTVRFIRTNPSASMMLVLYILMWWAPLRPAIMLTTGRSGIPFGINGPLEWMSRWWLSIDTPTVFQPIALIGAWYLIVQRRRVLQATWARSCRSAARRGAKWAATSWIPLALLLLAGTAAFLGHITPLAVTTLVWLPYGVVFYIYGPRVIRALHTPGLLLIAATAVPDTIPELTQKLVQRILGGVAVQCGKILGDTMTFDPGSAFNVADDYLRSGSLNAPIAAPMNGLALMSSTAVIAAIWTLQKRRGIASTAIAKVTAIAISGFCVLAHVVLIVITLHNGQRGYTVGALHNVLLLPLTVSATLVILNKLFSSSFGLMLRTYDRKAVSWFVGLPDLRRRSITRTKGNPQKPSKPAPPILGVLLRMILSPFRTYWRWLIRIDNKITKWQSASSRNKRPRR